MLCLASIVVATLLSSVPVLGNDGEFEQKELLTQHCPLLELQAVIPEIECPGTPLQCARSARALAQRQFANEGHHQGYAWGALVIRANSSISDQIAWSVNAVKPKGWFCTALSESQTYVVHVFRTGYRFRNSMQDQWTYLANRHHRTEICPLAVIKAYIDQHDQSIDSKSFVGGLLRYTKIEYPSGQFDHEQWNVMVVKPEGRKLLERDFDFSFPVYLYDGLAAWCMTSTSNGWLAVVVKIGYEDANEQGFSRSRRHMNRNL